MCVFVCVCVFVGPSLCACALVSVFLCVSA